MHEVNEPYLKNKNINKYFDRLSQVLASNNAGLHRVLVVGGAAVALKYRVGRATVDIDICVREQSNLYQYCMLVAREYNLPSDWINADVMHSDSFSMNLFKNAELYKVYNSVLEVYVVSDIDLLCMKLVSYRQKDLRDLKSIVARLNKGKISRDRVLQEFVFLYGSLYLLKPRARDYLYKNFK